MQVFQHPDECWKTTRLKNFAQLKMASFYTELSSSSSEEVASLIDGYWVRRHNGEEIQPGDDPLAFILEWLQPDYPESPIYDTTEGALQAVQQGLPFDPNSASQTDVLEVLLGDTLNVNADVIEDLGRYPMRNAWNAKSWDLYQGFLHSDNRREYFERITGASAADFLNDTERLFYLTRGYGRPNKYISGTDLLYRQFIQNSSPTALIVLSDLLGVCPGLQDPAAVLEGLSSVNLHSIDKYHYHLMDRVNKCLKMSICTAVGTPQSQSFCPGDTCSPRQFYGLENCDLNSVNCYKDLLRSTGAIDTVEYDPSTNVLVSNLSQADLYRNVVLDKKWSIDEVRNLPDAYVEGVLKLLPDQELLKITADGVALVDTIDLDSLEQRLRENLLNSAVAFLIESRFIFVGDQVRYGRLVDDLLDEYPAADVLETIREHKALLDPDGHPLTTDEAEILLQSHPDDDLQEAIYETQAQEINNIQYLNGLLPSERDALFKIFNTASEDGVEIEALGKIVSEFPQAGPLILWGKRRNWIPVAMTLEEYFRDWSPDWRQLIETTADYYRRTL